MNSHCYNPCFKCRYKMCPVCFSLYISWWFSKKDYCFLQKHWITLYFPWAVDIHYLLVNKKGCQNQQCVFVLAILINFIHFVVPVSWFLVWRADSKSLFLEDINLNGESNNFGVFCWWVFHLSDTMRILYLLSTISLSQPSKKSSCSPK